jgi:hypothetical protein
VATRLASTFRAALLGLCGGLLLGGLYLLGSSLHARLAPIDCAHLSPQACRLERAAEADMARWQLASGAALLALGAALALRLRAR